VDYPGVLVESCQLFVGDFTDYRADNTAKSRPSGWDARLRVLGAWVLSGIGGSWVLFCCWGRDLPRELKVLVGVRN